MAGPFRLLGKLGSRLGPPIFSVRQFCKENIEQKIKISQHHFHYFNFLF